MTRWVSAFAGALPCPAYRQRHIYFPKILDYYTT